MELPPCPKEPDPGLPLTWLFPELSLLAASDNRSRLIAAAAKIRPGYTIILTRGAATVISLRQGLEIRETESKEGNWILPLPGENPRAHLEEAIQSPAVHPRRLREAGLAPCFLTAPPGGPGPVETRLPLSWWGVLPGDNYPAPVRELTRELVRGLYPDRFFHFLAWENYALAGVDLLDQVRTRRFAGDTTPPAPARPFIIGICGTDGAGKSSHISGLAAFLEARGLRVKVHKIYRHGVFHDTITDLNRQCAGDKNLHLWRQQRITKVFDSLKYYFSKLEPNLNKYDVILGDRYIFTHLAASIGRFHHDPYSRELLAVFPTPHRTYLLDLPTTEAMARISRREERTVDENPYMLARFRAGLHAQARARNFLVLDGRRSYDDNQRIIRRDIVEILGDRQ